MLSTRAPETSSKQESYAIKLIRCNTDDSFGESVAAETQNHLTFNSHRCQSACLTS
jgi:hypothetical protein